VKTTFKNLISIIVKKHEFDNEFVYVEITSNSVLKDCFFAEKEFLNKDGSLKVGGKKYFFSGDDINVEKKIERIDCKGFSSFDNLFYYDSVGDINNIKNKK